MDAMKILGSLLGGGGVTSRKGDGALGGMLGSVLGGGAGAGNAGLSDLLGGALGARPGSGGGVGDLLGAALGGTGPRPGGSAGGGLGDVLGAALGGGGGRSGGGLGGVLGGVAMAALMKYAAGRLGGAGSTPSGASGLAGADLDLGAFETADANAEAELLIEAMIQAAKADGRIDPREERALLERLGELDDEERAFVAGKLREPADASALAARVPPGLAEQVYATSLLVIELDERSEARYLHELARGLGLDAARANAIHRELGEPEIFR